MKRMIDIKEFSQSHLDYLKDRKKRRAFIIAMRWAVLVLILCVWEVLTSLGVIDAFIFSSPTKIFKTLLGMTRSGELFLHAGITLAETLAGFFIATALGTGLALVFWWKEGLKQIFDPYVVVLNSLPKIALGPVIIIWFGSGTKAIIVMAVLITVIVTLITMLAGFEQTEQGKILLMRSLGASRLQILLHLVIPSSLPTFISMLKINVGLSWIGSIMGEYLVSKAGIGYLIVYGGQIFKMDLVFASTLVLCALATGMYAVIALIERLALKRR